MSRLVSRAQESHRGRRIADLFRRTRVTGEGRRCDLETICSDDGLEIIDSRLADPGYTACLFCGPAGVGGGIFLSPGQESGRRRFSISHELGHYHIPTHRTELMAGLKCGDRDMLADLRSTAVKEWEANDFASELLMPTKQFGLDVAARDISIEAARELASSELFDVSVTAAAWRMVQVSRGRCAIVVTSDGKIDWASSSSTLKLPGLRRGKSIDGATVSWSSSQTSISEPRGLDVSIHAWFEPQFTVNAKLVESTHVIRSTNQVVALLELLEYDGEDD